MESNVKQYETDFNSPNVFVERKAGYIERTVFILSTVFVIITFPISIFFCLKVATEYQRLVLLRMGRLIPHKSKAPGTFFVLPCIDDYYLVDLRTVSFDIPAQEILTKDSVTVHVDAVLFLQVRDPIRAVCCVKNYIRSTQLLGATTLRNYLGQKSLSALLAERDVLAVKMQATLDRATDPWGIYVERVEIKEVTLPIELQRAMASEAEATREARAVVISAQGEKDASQTLQEASRVMSESPGAIQLRYLQTLTTIAAEKNSTVIFPVPIEMLSHFMPK